MTEVNESSAYRYQVTARDPDGDSLNYSLPTKPAWLSMNSSGLITGTAPSVNSDTNVNLEARVSDGQETTSHSFAVSVKDVPTLSVSGTLQDSETDTGKAGEVRAYKNNGDGTYTLLKKTTAASNGAFSMSFSHSGNFDLQARLKQGTADKSYVRTIPTSSTSTLTGLTIRAVPYTDLSETQTVSATDTIVSIPEFKSFMEDVNQSFVFASGQGTRSGCTTAGCKGPIRWNLDNFNGVEILRENPTTNTGNFDTTKQNYIENKIKASDDVALLFDRRTVTVQKDATRTAQDANKKYTVSGSTITPDTGWIVVVPVRDPGYSGEATGGDSDNDGYFDGFTINLKSNSNIYADAFRIITHEFAHTTLYPGGDVAMGHTSRLVNDHSITSGLAVSGRTACTKPCTFDKKAAKLIYESTFAVGTPYSEILGTAWRTSE